MSFVSSQNPDLYLAIRISAARVERPLQAGAAIVLFSFESIISLLGLVTIVAKPIEPSSFSVITADVPTSPVCTVTTSPICILLLSFDFAKPSSRCIGLLSNSK